MTDKSDEKPLSKPLAEFEMTSLVTADKAVRFSIVSGELYINIRGGSGIRVPLNETILNLRRLEATLKKESKK